MTSVSVELSAGSMVEALGLVGAAHLNGKRGVLTGTKQGERFGVDFPPPDRVKALLPKNLVRVCVDAAEGDPHFGVPDIVHVGRHFTVSDAARLRDVLEVAKDGDTLHLTPGTYNIGSDMSYAQLMEMMRRGRRPTPDMQPLQVNASVIIVGDLEHTMPVLCGSGGHAVIQWKAAAGCLRHVSILQKHFDVMCGSALEVNGSPLIDGCNIRTESLGQSGADPISLSVHGAYPPVGRGACPIIRECDISGTGIGVSITFGGSRPTLYRNNIHDNLEFGIFNTDGADAIVRRNCVHHNKCGILIGGRMYEQDHQTKGTIENNDIYGNLGGIRVDNGPEPTIQGNYIHGNKRSGIGVARSSVPRLIGNMIHGNGACGIKLTTSAHAEFSDNIVYSNSAGEIADGSREIECPDELFQM